MSVFPYMVEWGYLGHVCAGTGLAAGHCDQGRDAVVIVPGRARLIKQNRGRRTGEQQKGTHKGCRCPYTQSSFCNRVEHTAAARGSMIRRRALMWRLGLRPTVRRRRRSCHCPGLSWGGPERRFRCNWCYGTYWSVQAALGGLGLDSGRLTFAPTGISTGKTWSVHGGARRTATPY